MDAPSEPPKPSAASASPAMARWFEIKREYADALLFYRMGDFYELFFGDAEAAAAALDIALTTRGEHAGTPIPMCGVPVHAGEAYLARLIRRGFRIAIAEQMEDAKTRRNAKTPIRRDVVRLITPGTLTEDSLLEPGQPNLLLALAEDRDGLGAAWLDISTGLFETVRLPRSGLPGLLGRLDPAEILAPEAVPLGDWEPRRAPASAAPPPLAARRRVAEAFGVASLDAFGSFGDADAMAAAAALDYVRATQAGNLPRLSRPVPRGAAGLLMLDAATRASLDILRARDAGSPHTLFGAVDRTATGPGARLLAARLAAPLLDPAAIGARQDCWSWLLADRDTATALRTALRGVPDIARALGRLSLDRGGPRDLAAIRDGLAAAARAASALLGSLPAELDKAAAALTVDPRLETTLRAALADPAPLRLGDAEAVRAGFDAELDAECRLRDDSRRVLATLQRDLAQRYAVASLKIRHHAQLGYVIEVPAAAVEALRVRTLARTETFMPMKPCGARQDRADNEADGDSGREQEIQPDQNDNAHNGDRCVLPLQIGLCALGDRARDLLHPRGPRTRRHQLGDGDRTIDERQESSQNDQTECDWRHRLPVSLRTDGSVSWL